MRSEYTNEDQIAQRFDELMAKGKLHILYYTSRVRSVVANVNVASASDYVCRRFRSASSHAVSA